MTLLDLLLLGWAVLNSALILAVVMFVQRQGRTAGRRMHDLETRMTHLESTQREILHEVRAGRAALHALATQQQIVEAVDRAVETAFGKRLSPRRDPLRGVPPAPAATHFHGPTTVHGPLAGGNIGRIEDGEA